MRTDLMTAEECQERYEAEPTARNALVLSIEKWERTSVGANWKGDLGSANTCGLCQRYGGTCQECPLGSGENCDRASHPYDKAINARFHGNRPAFMAARKNLLRRMRRALAKLEKDGE